MMSMSLLWEFGGGAEEVRGKAESLCVIAFAAVLF